MNVKMGVAIGGLTLKNPVMSASGTFGYGEEYVDYLDLNRLGAIVVKGLSLKPREGNPPPRIIETASGMLNAVGLQNVGAEAFIDKKLPYLRTIDSAVVANIFGESIEEYAKVAQILSNAGGVDALEVNISCPNVRKGGVAFGSDPLLAGEVTRAVKDVSRLPVIVKLTPNVTDITEIARSVEAAGADALSLINTLTGMSIDIERRVPHLKNITGGLSGPAIKPVALRMVWETVNAVSIPVIGVGGIVNASDALEFLIAGARAVQVGTANFINPSVVAEIVDGIERYLSENNLDDIHDLIGTLRV
ncbi:MAG: dihydroorotate dehydrogenase [Deltaproteobacteria bacterium]|nr:dihydroorotate dehydrogenase [Deltaproteobacteria bacterium]MBW2674578.1 dihydroorotate dehydrogenase [Deltaproteobacteria bacterium]